MAIDLILENSVELMDRIPIFLPLSCLAHPHDVFLRIHLNTHEYLQGFRRSFEDALQIVESVLFLIMALRNSHQGKKGNS